MANLNITFSGLFLWVKDGANAMYVLAPSTANGSYPVEAHVARLVVPGHPVPYDIRGMELRLGAGGIGGANLKNHFDCSSDGGEVDASLLGLAPGTTLLQNRFVFASGSLSRVYAPIQFSIGSGATQCIASEVVWTIPLDATASVALQFTSLESGVAVHPPIVLSSSGGADVDVTIHHVPSSHLTGGHVHPPLKASQPAKHVPALYNVLTKYQSIQIPLTTGEKCSGAGPFTTMGGDPVTCGQGTARMATALGTPGASSGTAATSGTSHHPTSASETSL